MGKMVFIEIIGHFLCMKSCEVGPTIVQWNTLETNINYLIPSVALSTNDKGNVMWDITLCQ